MITSKFIFSLLFNYLLYSIINYSIAQGNEDESEGTLELSSGSGGMNQTCPRNLDCRDLPANCIECTFNQSCVYGQPNNVTCTPLEEAVCEGEQEFNRTFICRFCYQLPLELTCCSPNTDCNIRGTPRSTYLSNCTAFNTELCIPPRDFMRKLPCNYTTGVRWSTAFLLSITLGGFGVDRFYLGHWRSALGKLFSFGGLGVWSILDVILISTGYLTPENGSAYIY